MDYDFYGNTSCDTLLVTYGRLFSNCCEAKEILSQKGKEVCILKLNRIKPLPKEALVKSLDFSNIHFYEEGMLNGSIGYSFNTKLCKNGFKGNMEIHAINDEFVTHQTVEQAFVQLGFDTQSIVKDILEEI